MPKRSFGPRRRRCAGPYLVGMEDRPLPRRLAAALVRPAVQDILAALLLASLSLVSLWNPSPLVHYDFREPDALGVLLALVVAAAVAVRSRHPEAALLVTLAATIPLAQLGYHQGIGGLASLLALYSVAVSRPWRISVPLVLLTLTCVGVLLLTAPLASTLSDWIANLLVIVVAWIFGRSVRVRRVHQVAIAARNEARARAHHAESRAVLVEERTRVAREMQDLVAHNLTEVGVQIAAARRTLRTGDVPSVERLLLDAEQASRSAIAEMRRAVSVLGRSDGDVALHPQPGVGDLDELVHREAAHGNLVQLTSTGAPRSVPAGTALAAYRVVEQSLHELREDAPGRRPGRAEVGVEWQVDTLCVRVHGEPGTPAIGWDGTDLPDSRRITRLRNRVEAYGGKLGCDRTREGGFVVTARFPLAAPGRSA